ncbi:hypothetical protein [Hahella sp. CCB-MM4]|nr:hypothetical protein [Hahella sp. CCB-MM4]
MKLSGRNLLRAVKEFLSLLAIELKVGTKLYLIVVCSGGLNVCNLK